jgi:hypothetical protein
MLNRIARVIKHGPPGQFRFTADELRHGRAVALRAILRHACRHDHCAENPEGGGKAHGTDTALHNIAYSILGLLPQVCSTVPQPGKLPRLRAVGVRYRFARE